MNLRVSPRHESGRAFLLLLSAAAIVLPAGAQEPKGVEQRPKILLLFDVSASMSTIDEAAEPDQDPSKLPTRLDRILQILSRKPAAGAPALLPELLDKADIVAYRFGGVLDDLDTIQLKRGQTRTPQQWRAWLKLQGMAGKEPGKNDVPPVLAENLLAGTDVAGAALHALRLEADSHVQAMVVFSDGRANRGTAEDLTELHARLARGPKSIPLITIGVGSARPPPGLHVGHLQTSESARAGERFQVRVPVSGVGLADEEFAVALEVQRLADATGRPVTGEKYRIGPTRGKLKKAGEHAADVVEFLIDLA